MSPRSCHWLRVVENVLIWLSGEEEGEEEEGVGVNLNPYNRNQSHDIND